MVENHVIGTVPERNAVSNGVTYPEMRHNDVVRVPDIEPLAFQGNPGCGGRRAVNGEEGLVPELQGALQGNRPPDAKDNAAVVAAQGGP